MVGGVIGSFVTSLNKIISVPMQKPSMLVAPGLAWMMSLAWKYPRSDIVAVASPAHTVLLCRKLLMSVVGSCGGVGGCGQLGYGYCGWVGM